MFVFDLFVVHSICLRAKFSGTGRIFNWQVSHSLMVARRRIIMKAMLRVFFNRVDLDVCLKLACQR